jgi:hypothetical protein
VVFIHGAWLSARSRENYVDYFGKCGFAVSAPEWPRKQGDVDEMRETAEASAGLGVQEIVDHYEQLIRDLGQPLVLIGIPMAACSWSCCSTAVWDGPVWR